MHVLVTKETLSSVMLSYSLISSACGPSLAASRTNWSR